MRIIAILQGLYFVITGIWPLLSIRAFQAVTGPKTDLWLVKTVGLLVTVVGFVIFLGGIHGSITFEIFILAVTSAGVLAAVDVNYSLNRTISRIYLLDAMVEFALILVWIRAWFSV